MQWPIIVAARSKTWTAFARPKTGIVGSNPTHGMDICLHLFCLCVGGCLATGWSPVQEVLPIVLGLRNWSETKRFTDALGSKVGTTGRLDRQTMQSQNIIRRFEYIKVKLYGESQNAETLHSQEINFYVTRTQGPRQHNHRHEWVNS
jgi:hypothetical protein